METGALFKYNSNGQKCPKGPFNKNLQQMNLPQFDNES